MPEPITIQVAGCDGMISHTSDPPMRIHRFVSLRKGSHEMQRTRGGCVVYGAALMYVTDADSDWRQEETAAH